MIYRIFFVFSAVTILSFAFISGSESACAQSPVPPPAPENFVGDRTVRVKLLLRVKDVSSAGVEIGKVFEDFGGTVSSRGVSDGYPNFFGEDSSKYSNIDNSRSGNVDARVPLEKLDVVKNSVKKIAMEVLYESVSAVDNDAKEMSAQKGRAMAMPQVAEFSISLAQDVRDDMELQESQSDIWKIFAILTGIILASLFGFALARRIYSKNA